MKISCKYKNNKATSKTLFFSKAHPEWMVNPGPSSAVIVPKGTVPGMPELEPDLESRNIIELRKHCEEKIKK